MAILHSKVWKLLLLAIFILVAGFGNVFLRHENVWDLVNYHYYNPWAFFHNRLGYDIAPAMVNTYFNPLIDIPYYLMIKYWNIYPKLINFFQGVPYGILLYVFYKIVTLFFDIKKELLLNIVTVLIGATGFAIYSQWGVSSNEVQVSILILLGFYLICKHICDNHRQINVWIWSGLLMGCALGLKPTVITYCVAMGLSLVIFMKPLKVSVKEIIIFALSGLIGYLIINGWWMWQLYTHFDNPFFPFLNRIFKSEYFGNFNFQDEGFTRHMGFFRVLFLPFIILFDPLFVSEKLFSDMRFMCAWIIFFIIFLRYIKCKNICFLDSKELMLGSFLFFSYIIWVNLFAIIRYAIVMEILSAIFIVKYLKLWNPKNIVMKMFVDAFKITCVLVMLFSNLLYSMSWGNLDKNEQYVEMEKIFLPHNALIQLSGSPTAMPAAMFVNRLDNRIIASSGRGYINAFDLVEKWKLKKQRENITKNHKGPVVVLLAMDWGDNMFFLEELKHKNMYCRDLHFTLRAIKICVPYELKNQILLEENKYGSKQ